MQYVGVRVILNMFLTRLRREDLSFCGSFLLFYQRVAEGPNKQLQGSKKAIRYRVICAI
jgi:hypothetical protein